MMAYSKKKTGRLSVKDAIGQTTSIPIHQSTNQSASLSKLDREFKELKEENVKLKMELLEERSMLEQLLNESKHEKFDERRVNLLKAQIIQLERQTLILTEALGCRSENLVEVENTLRWLADEIRFYIAADVKGSTVPVSRADLMAMVSKAESTRIKLYKRIENNSKENLMKPLMFMTDFVKKKQRRDITLLDVASGELSHLNLKHVGQLESKLSQLYKELIRLNESLCEMDGSAKRISSGHMTEIFKQRLITDVTKASTQCKDCTTDLLSLSLLYPAAHWSALKRPLVKEVSIEDFMSVLPTLPRQKTAGVHHCVEALLKTCNYRQTLLEKEVKALREEVKFHQSIYDHQLRYIDSLFTAVKDGYLSFENSIQNVLVEPLKETLMNYQELKTTASEKALHDFLSNFKNNETKLQTVVEKLEHFSEENCKKNGNEVFSVFGEEFFCMIEGLVVKQQEKRDAEIAGRREMKEEQEQREEEVKQMIQNLKDKKTQLRELKELKDFDPSLSSQQSKDISSLEQSSCETSMSKLSETMLTDTTDNSSVIESPKNNEDNVVPKTVKPPSGKEKKKLSKVGPGPKQPRNYKPDLVVPNRTLKLRKSNSLTKLNSDQPSEDQSLLTELSELSISNSDLQPPSRSLAPLPKKKAPFY